MEGNQEIEFMPVKKEEVDKFANDMVDSFSVSVKENHMPDIMIPPKSSIYDSFNNPKSEIYHIIVNKEKVGGVVLLIDNETNHNHLDLLFLYTGKNNKGLGYTIWKAIESRYPNTKIWETCTPYFEKRNINFYINKCGFKAVEFINEHHKGDEEYYIGEFLRFEKEMK